MVYSVARMSDGERTALVLLADVVSAEEGTVFVIDEPELHIHRSIVVPLLTSMIAERPDCSFVLCTHELELVEDRGGAQVVVCRGYEWEGDTPKFWDVDVVTNLDDVATDLRVDILGSRRKIVFVEGKASSLDEPFYSLLFPEVSVRASRDCKQVVRAVVGVSETFALHNIDAFGIVDNDGMSEEFAADLEGKQVYALPVHTIESLYYSEPLLTSVAKDAALRLKQPFPAFLELAKSAALNSLKEENIIHLALSVSQRKYRDALMSILPNRQDMIDGHSVKIDVVAKEIYENEIRRLRILIADRDLATVIAKYPVRESKVLDVLSNKLRFLSRSDFELTALTLLDNDKQLADDVRSILKTLSAKLQSSIELVL